MKPHTAENLPAYLLKHIRIRHLKGIQLRQSDLVQLRDESPHQPVREFAKWKLRKVGNLNQN